MKRIQSKYGSIVLVLVSIGMLSMKDTFRLAHTLLHKIPNPFHHHDTPQLVYSHETSSNRSFFYHSKHGHEHGFHNLEDHLSSHKKEEAKSSSKEKSSKKELEKSHKYNLFWQELFPVHLTSFFYPKNLWRFYLTPFLACSTTFPPSPPPESSI